MSNASDAFIVGYFSCLIGGWSDYLDVSSKLDLAVINNSEYCADVAIEPIQLSPGLGNVPQPRPENIDVAKSKIIWDYGSSNVQIQINLQIIYIKTYNLYIWDYNSQINLGSIYSLYLMFTKQE